jgi:hypothetical protein
MGRNPGAKESGTGNTGQIANVTGIRFCSRKHLLAAAPIFKLPLKCFFCKVALSSCYIKPFLPGSGK